MATTGVTVIIPVYNRQQTGEAAARSALAQSGCDVEVVIVDDASTPAFALPPDLAADARIRLIRSDVNGGPAASRNLGLAAATQPWVAFLDSDDRFLPGKLARQLAFANPSRPLDVVATGFIYARRLTNEEQRLIPASASDVATFCAGCWHCPGSTLLASRAVFDTVGMLDSRLRRLEDLEWFIRLGLKGGSLTVVPEPLAWIDVGVNASIVNVDKAAALIAATYLDRPEKLADRKAQRNLAAYLALERAAAQYKKTGFWAAAPHLLRSFWLKPRLRKHLGVWWRVG
ncbi:glycosyltransferase family 2 protein [Rhodoplanes sp. SY1]|uniref:glycosyltransferase family 2 protein n=1 Tax=Rhodoplanes sp. SY1 TaxID=3166646 RepID=UPI0038B4732A